MPDSNETPSSNTANSPPSMQRRRGSSFAGQTFQDLYEAARTRQASDSAQSATSPNFPPGSISSAFQAHRRRLSLTTVGLGNPANPVPSPFTGFGAHRDSTTSTSTASIDEQAIDDDGGPSVSQYPTGNNQQQPHSATPFGRRMSFGARAMRDAKTGPAAGRSMNDSSMGWVDSFVNRGDRRASINFPRDVPSTIGFKARTQSAVDPQQTSTVPAMPARAVPDAYSERILRGEVDF